MTLGLPERIESKISPEPNSGCWLWVNKPNKKTGYARIFWDGTRRDAHGVVYRLVCGEIPEGRELDHLCRVRSCVNPQHLEPVTRAEHGARSLRARQTHCSRGHLLFGDNIFDRSANGNRRKCKICNRMTPAERRA